MKKYIIALFVLSLLAGNCNGQSKPKPAAAHTATKSPDLPEPYATKSVTNLSKVIGWPGTLTPMAPAGFRVTPYVQNLQSARWMYVLPNGDVLVAQANSESKGLKKVAEAVAGQSKGESPDQLTLLRDTDRDGKPDMQEVFLSGIKQPFGMLLLDTFVYVAATDALWRFPYHLGQSKIKTGGEKIADLPGEGRHWTRNIIANSKGTKIYIAIGSSSDHAEKGIANEESRACIVEINPDGSGRRIYASGLRNPVGMGWAPGTNTLWTAVNERDQLGNDLVPDYLTSVKDGGFYGWPYSYFGTHKDPRLDDKEQRPDLVSKAIVPDCDLGPHTASLGLAFYTLSEFPVRYRNGAFIGQHGSWNRDPLSGYKVVFVPFKNGKPSGPPEDFLTGFIADEKKSEVFGRPVGVCLLPDGSLLVADDGSDVIWRVEYSKH